MAALEDLFDESRRKQRRTKACGRTKKKKRWLKRTTEEIGSAGKRGPHRRELTNYRRTFK